MATPPGERPYDGGAQQPEGEQSHHGYPFPPAPGRADGRPSWSAPEPAQEPYRQPYEPSYGASYDPRYGAQQAGGPGPYDPGTPQPPHQPHQPYQPHQPHQPHDQYDRHGGYGQPGGRHGVPGPAQQPGQPRPYQQRPPGRRRPEPAPGQGGPSPLVRPYAMTGGRTRPRYQLAIEALVSTTADPSRLQGQLPEHQRICRLCFEIKSVAEISALLSLPLGVARILVADLAEAGLVAIHQPGGDDTAGGQPDVTLLERVLSGLRKL
ncbi:DUF742 domain-containing protein [Streptomyces sp. NPDC094448]|uniref:DUF742 domain-containing protein n=1 Tax=Streptomyces sp. NPDC094448 TaxID=3366063 RepID=UPI00380E810A